MESHRAERALRRILLRQAITLLPAPLLELGLDAATTTILRRHPGIADRLGALAGARVLIEFSDLERALLVSFGPPRLRLALPRDRAAATASIRGPLARLLDLIDGEVDGDAIFFARELTVAGDTGVIVALRNAIDGEEIDVAEDLVQALGPFAGAARRVRARLAAVAAAAERVAGEWQARLLAPALARCERLAVEIEAVRRRGGKG
jgi:predicted lipid carrier protein YhbT